MAVLQKNGAVPKITKCKTAPALAWVGGRSPDVAVEFAISSVSGDADSLRGRRICRCRKRSCHTLLSFAVVKMERRRNVEVEREREHFQSGQINTLLFRAHQSNNLILNQLVNIVDSY